MHREEESKKVNVQLTGLFSRLGCFVLRKNLERFSKMSEEEILKVEQMLIEPNICPLNAPLSISMQFSINRPIYQMQWELVYEADFTNKRKTVNLQVTPCGDVAAGSHVFQVQLPGINTDGIKEKYLLQMGVLKLTLHGANEPNICSVNMVTQVSKDDNGTLIRNIISPLE